MKKRPHDRVHSTSGIALLRGSAICLWMFTGAFLAPLDLTAQTPARVPESVKDRFTKLDANKDGQVTLDEFSASVAVKPSAKGDKSVAPKKGDGTAQVTPDPPKKPNPPKSGPGTPQVPVYPPGIDPPKTPSKTLLESIKTDQVDLDKRKVPLTQPKGKPSTGGDFLFELKRKPPAGEGPSTQTPGK